MTPFLLWLGAHPNVWIALTVLGSAAVLTLAVIWPLGTFHVQPTPGADFAPRPTGLVTRVPFRPFDWSIDAPEVAGP